MSQSQTSRDCFAMTASLLHIKNSFHNALWRWAWQNNGEKGWNQISEYILGDFSWNAQEENTPILYIYYRIAKEFCYFVEVNVNAFWVKVFPSSPSAVMEWHSMPFSLLNGIFVKALWIQPALSLKPQRVLREENICEWNLSPTILAASGPNNDAFITSGAQQTKRAFLWHTTRCVISQYNDIHYVYNIQSVSAVC